MPSRAEWRRWLEWALRVALVTALAFALWRSVRATRPGATSLAVRASALGDALQQATTSPRVGTLSVAVDSTVDPVRRAWLVALRRAGVGVHWHGEQPALAVTVDRAREPVARARVRVIADSSGTIVISDSVGVIDSLQAAGGAALEAADIVGAVTARRGSFAASVTPPARTDRRDVLVLGRAGWESRFVLAALGEAGWRIRGRLPVAPGAAVVDASLLPIDTARYDVVIALDSTAADLSTAIARFVAQGGGAIVAGSALDIGALRALAPARTGARRAGRILLDSDTLARADLPIRPLVGVRPDAIALERQPSGLAVAIRRAGRGRVAALGYDETWRWRMQGGEAGETAHRAWWSRMVGLVAPERTDQASRGATASDDPAPRAALVAALGPPSEEDVIAARPASDRLPLVLLVLALAALLAETASRRFRGES
jgi:hypothetical protein